MPATQAVYGSAEVNGQQLELVIGGKTPRDSSGKQSSTETNVVVETQQTNKAASGKVTALGNGVAGDELAINLTDDTVFTGTIRKTEDAIGDRTRLVAFDALHDLKRATISETFDTEAAASALRTVADTAGINIDIRGDASEPITATFKSANGDAAVEKLTKLAGKVWYVSVENTLIVTDASSVGESKQLDRIIDASAGKRSPAYQSVKVIGNTPTSRKGRQSRQLVSSQPVSATAGSGDPVYEYEDDDIASSQQAQNVADALLQRLRKQQRGGFVEVLARSDIRPFDTVVMPPSRGGAEYLVEAVKHTVDAKNGYLTRLQLGGVITA